MNRAEHLEKFRPAVRYATPEEEARFKPLFEATRAANTWYSKHNAELDEYEGQWIAVGPDGVVASDEDFEVLHRKLLDMNAPLNKLIHEYILPQDVLYVF